MNKKAGKKNIIWMGLASFFTDTSSEMIFPILPLFLANVIGAPATAIGFIEGIAEATASLMKAASGWLSDKLHKRKMIVFFGYSFSTLSKPFLGFATSWWSVFTVRVLDRFGKGVRDSPRDALIAASTEQKTRGRLFGLHRMLDAAGAVLGTLLVFWLLYSLKLSYKTIFFLTAIPGVIAVFIVLFMVRDVKDGAEKKNPNFKFSAEYKKFLFISTIFSIGNFSYAFFVLKAQKVGIAVAVIPLVYLVYKITLMATPMSAGRLSDKLGRKSIIGFGYMLAILTFIGLALATMNWQIWILFAMYGVFLAIFNTVSAAYVADLTGEEKRGTGMGVYYTLIGLAALPSSFIAGMLWDRYGPETMFFFGAAMAGLAFVLLFFLMRNGASPAGMTLKKHF
ncbi:MAG: MFS transporter [Candidatus Aenigmatarchaeota archaeon]